MPTGYRNIFYPSGPKPVKSYNEELDFMSTSYPSLSPQQFADTRNSRRYTQPSTLEKTSLSAAYDLVSSKDVPTLSTGTPAELWKQNSHRLNDFPPGPYDGRTVEISSGDSITSAWAKLNTLLRVNNVRQELRRTIRHEQKGEKRRRLVSERWRRKFADEVRKKVKLVIEMRNRDRMWGAKH